MTVFAVQLPIGRYRSKGQEPIEPLCQVSRAKKSLSPFPEEVWYPPATMIPSHLRLVDAT